MARNRSTPRRLRWGSSAAPDESFFEDEAGRWRPRPDSPEVSVFSPAEEAESDARWRRAVLRERFRGPVSGAELAGVGLSAAALAALVAELDRESNTGEEAQDREASDGSAARNGKVAAAELPDKPAIVSKAFASTDPADGDDTPVSNPFSVRGDAALGARRATARGSGGGTLESRAAGGAERGDAAAAVLRKAEAAPADARAPSLAESTLAVRIPLEADVVTMAIAMRADVPAAREGDRHAEARHPTATAAVAAPAKPEAGRPSGEAPGQAKDAPPAADAKVADQQQQRQGPVEAVVREKAGDAPVVTEAKAFADKGRSAPESAAVRTTEKDAVAAAKADAGGHRSASEPAPVEAKAKDAQAVAAELASSDKPAKALGQAKAKDVEAVEAKADHGRSATEALVQAKVKDAPPAVEIRSEAPEQLQAKAVVVVVAGSEVAGQGDGLAMTVGGAAAQAKTTNVATPGKVATAPTLDRAEALEPSTAPDAQIAAFKTEPASASAGTQPLAKVQDLGAVAGKAGPDRAPAETPGLAKASDTAVAGAVEVKADTVRTAIEAPGQPNAKAVSAAADAKAGQGHSGAAEAPVNQAGTENAGGEVKAVPVVTEAPKAVASTTDATAEPGQRPTEAATQAKQVPTVTDAKPVTDSAGAQPPAKDALITPKAPAPAEATARAAVEDVPPAPAAKTQPAPDPADATPDKAEAKTTDRGQGQQRPAGETDAPAKEAPAAAKVDPGQDSVEASAHKAQDAPAPVQTSKGEQGPRPAEAPGPAKEAAAPDKAENKVADDRGQSQQRPAADVDAQQVKGKDSAPAVVAPDKAEDKADHRGGPEQPQRPAAEDDVQRAKDVSPDTAKDAVPDAPKDAGKDTAKDTSPDTPKDAGKDAIKDVDKDTGKDAAKDVDKDTGKDAAKDSAPAVVPAVAKDPGKDAAKDASPDAAKDAGKDATKDTSPDAAKDASPDAAKDIGKDTTPAAVAPEAAKDISPNKVEGSADHRGGPPQQRPAGEADAQQAKDTGKDAPKDNAPDAGKDAIKDAASSEAAKDAGRDSGKDAAPDKAEGKAAPAKDAVPAVAENTGKDAGKDAPKDVGDHTPEGTAPDKAAEAKGDHRGGPQQQRPAAEADAQQTRAKDAVLDNRAGDKARNDGKDVAPDTVAESKAGPAKDVAPDTVEQGPGLAGVPGSAKEEAPVAAPKGDTVSKPVEVPLVYVADPLPGKGEVPGDGKSLALPPGDASPVVLHVSGLMGPDADQGKGGKLVVEDGGRSGGGGGGDGGGAVPSAPASNGKGGAAAPDQTGQLDGISGKANNPSQADKGGDPVPTKVLTDVAPPTGAEKTSSGKGGKQQDEVLIGPSPAHNDVLGDFVFSPTPAKGPGNGQAPAVVDAPAAFPTAPVLPDSLWLSVPNDAILL
jgi:hypothetical protein